MEDAMIASAQSERKAPQQARRGPAKRLALGVLLCLAVAARAEQPATEPVPAAPAQQTMPSETPISTPQAPGQTGFFGTIGRWIDGSIAGAGALWKQKSDASSAEAPKSLQIDLLPKAKVVSGRERCETAANGAPDCRGAIEALCRGKGLAAGKSIDIKSVEKCPARVWISGTRRTQGECRTESYVQRALCQ
jgi:hypothetical protein